MSADEDKKVKEALALIDQGWTQLNSQCSSRPKRNVIFVLGGTGAGKSTVTQIVTGDLRRLHSTPGQHGGLVIVDEVEPGNGAREGRIGDPQVASKTFLPEYLSCDDDTSLVFVDCPGFNDNRGTQMDIAAMVLIKKIAEHVDHARFLFVIPSSSVSYSNMNRNDFLLLCTHATSFVKNQDKMKDSMGLIVTKVNNCDPATGKKIEDKAVIEETTRFLEEVCCQKSTSIEIRRFVEYLLRDKSKWGLIHFPTDTGPLSEIEHFVQVRQQIRQICQGKLATVPVNSSDFAITLSWDSKYIIAKRLIPFMKGEIDRIVIGLVGEMEIGFITRFQSELQGHASSMLVVTVKNLEEICNKLKQPEQGQSRADRISVASKVTLVGEWLQINMTEEKMTELKEVEEKLYLFQQVTEETDTENASSVKITNAFNSLTTKLEEMLKTTLKTVKENRVRHVESQIKEQVHKMVKEFEGDYKSGFWSALENGDEFGREALEKLTSDWSKIEKLERIGIQKLSVTLKSIGDEMASPMKEDSVATLEELENELEMLLELTDQLNRSSGDGGNILPEIRSALRNLQTEARETVRVKYIKLVHNKVQQQSNALFGALDGHFFQESFYPGLDLETMSLKRQMLTTAHNNLQQCRRNFLGILDGIREMFRMFGTELPITEENLLGHYETLLEFYDSILGNSVARPIDEWMKGLGSLQNKIHEMDILYEFLELVKNTNPNTIEQDLGTHCGDVDGTILLFLEAFRATSEIRHIVHQRAQAEDKALIQNLAKYVENGKTSFDSMDGGTLVVKGREVKFSEFLNDSGLPRQSMSKILVLASDTVQLDRDVQGKGKQLTITVIADKWVVKGGSRNINLSGNDGLPHQDRKAKSGKDYEEDGTAGVPGNCGGNAGNFYGIHNDIVNAGSLCIYANGGNGGPGQSGGDGFIGRAGRDATVDDADIPLGKVGRFLARVGATIVPNPIIYGKIGSKGGDGGNGGAGGIPGLEGTITLYSTGDVEADISALSSRGGSAGQPGMGGKGARGGKNGNDLEFTSLGRYVFAGDAEQVDSRRGSDGKDGVTGGNSRGQRTPSQQTNSELDWRDVEKFRQYILEECQGNTNGQRFLQLIDSHPGINEILHQFSLLSLCTHLYNLELCFYRNFSFAGVTTTLTFIQEYISYQNRLLGYVTKLSGSELETQKYFLSFLYAASLSKLLALREHKQSCSTVVNVHLYLKSLSPRIQDLEQVSTQQWRFDHYTAYDNQLTGKIAQLKSVIESTSVAVLGQIEAKLENSLKQVIVDEQALLQNQLESEKSESYFTIGKLFEGIFTVASCVSFFGTVARSVYGFIKAIPAAGRGIISIVKNGEVFRNMGQYCMKQLMESEFVRDLVSNIAQAVKNVKGMVSQISAMLGGQHGGAADILQSFEDVLGKVGKALEKLEKISREGNTVGICGKMEAMGEMEKNIGGLIQMIIQKKNELLSGRNSSPEVVGKLDKILGVIMAARSKVRFSEAQCQEGNFKISRQTEQAILSLEKKKQAVYSLIMPALKTIMSDLENLSNNYVETNSASRIVSKWKLKVTMDQLRMHLNGFVEGAAAVGLNNHEVVECVAQLNGGISLTIELYDEIAKFEEKRELATFINDMSNTPTPEAMIINSIPAENSELRAAVMKIGFLVKTNLFLVDWVIAVKAFKQWAFPFAEKWFPIHDNRALTSGLSSAIADALNNNGDVSDFEQSFILVARNYIDKYRRLMNILSDYRATAPEIDRIRFTRDFNENVPFYRWAWKNHGNAIQALLQEQKVKLMADVYKTPWQRRGGSVKRGAVKFQTVQLHLKCSGTGDDKQKVLDELLNGYRVTMTHSGRSQYMVKGQVFVLQCGSQPEISYTFDKNTRNLVYIKNETVGDYLHSPYTEWTFKLTEVDENDYFGNGDESRVEKSSRRKELMERFAREEIDLELCGNGCYVDEGEAIEKGLDQQFFQNLSIYYYDHN